MPYACWGNDNGYHQLYALVNHFDNNTNNSDQITSHNWTCTNYHTTLHWKVCNPHNRNQTYKQTKKTNTFSLSVSPSPSNTQHKEKGLALKQTSLLSTTRNSATPKDSASRIEKIGMQQPMRLCLSPLHTQRKILLCKTQNTNSKDTHKQIPLHNSPAKVCCHPTTPQNLK